MEAEVVNKLKQQLSGRGGSDRTRQGSRERKVLTQEAFELIAGRFRVLAEPMRLRLLHALGDIEMSVSQLVEATGAGQANVSKHLGIMLDAGLVGRRKEGLNVFYRVADPSVFEMCEAVCSSLGQRLAAHRAAIRGFGV
jgi:DNA-binding transcriptional ArsR family regulator